MCRYPTGVDDVAEAFAAALSSSGFSSEARPDVMRFKWAKLLMNLANALEAACGQIDQRSGLAAAARAEGREVMEAAGIDRARSAEETARRGALVKILPIDGATRSGGDRRAHV